MDDVIKDLIFKHVRIRECLITLSSVSFLSFVNINLRCKERRQGQKWLSNHPLTSLLWIATTISLFIYLFIYFVLQTSSLFIKLKQLGHVRTYSHVVIKLAVELQQNIFSSLPLLSLLLKEICSPLPKKKKKQINLVICLLIQIRFLFFLL